ncbi:alanine--glyoxylate aminotransferase family protein [Candidatus Bipolaricaulota bacterium]|nr:alanine--glyoxylate aminotransferase family protein [Candidatus Bipolaricaulota bacterium]
MKDRALLMIPGPIEFEPEVLAALGAPTTSHVDPDFIEVFGQALERMREVWLCPSGQPFVVAGSGMLAMEMAVANLIEPGDKALVLSTGVFGDRYGELLSRYNAEVTVLRAPLGDTIALEEVDVALKANSYKLITFTHVDTSTGVRVDVKSLGALGREYGVLTVLDGVCSVAGEELRQEEWGIDVALTASQKAIGVPPGLALMVVSPRALAAWRERKTPVTNYYTDWNNWLPIMEAYEARQPSYFGTPPVNSIFALNVSLGQILTEGMSERFARHCKLGAACKAAIRVLGMSQVPTNSAHAAATLTAPYYPEGIIGSEFLPKVKAAGAILAGGLHPEIKARYFRIGHMGATNQGDLLATIGAIETGLRGCGYDCELGVGVAAAQQTLNR